MSRFLIFTDLNGTLLDQASQSTPEAHALARQVVASGVPLIFCSSKTFEEQRIIQGEFGFSMPCIVENGGAIAVPDGFWTEPLVGSGVHSENGWSFLVLGLTHGEIERRIHKIESKIGESLHGLSSMQTEDVASLTGLDIVSARRAQKRLYSETLAVRKPDSFWDGVEALFVEQGLSCMENGIFKTIVSAECDKGTALRTFMGIHGENTNRYDYLSIGVGDGPNDRDLLTAADVSYQVMDGSGSWTNMDDVVRVNSVGPAGWVKAVKGLIENAPSQMAK